MRIAQITNSIGQLIGHVLDRSQRARLEELVSPGVHVSKTDMSYASFATWHLFGVSGQSAGWQPTAPIRRPLELTSDAIRTELVRRWLNRVTTRALALAALTNLMRLPHRKILVLLSSGSSGDGLASLPEQLHDEFLAKSQQTDFGLTDPIELHSDGDGACVDAQDVSSAFARYLTDKLCTVLNAAAGPYGDPQPFPMDTEELASLKADWQQRLQSDHPHAARYVVFLKTSVATLVRDDGRPLSSLPDYATAVANLVEDFLMKLQQTLPASAKAIILLRHEPVDALAQESGTIDLEDDFQLALRTSLGNPASQVMVEVLPKLGAVRRSDVEGLLSIAFRQNDPGKEIDATKFAAQVDSIMKATKGEFAATARMLEDLLLRRAPPHTSSEREEEAR